MESLQSEVIILVHVYKREVERAGEFGEFGKSSVIRQTKNHPNFTCILVLDESIHLLNFSTTNAHKSKLFLPSSEVG